MREEKHIVALDDYEHRIVVNALNQMRNNLLKEQGKKDVVDDLLIKVIDAPIQKQKVKDYDAR